MRTRCECSIICIPPNTEMIDNPTALGTSGGDPRRRDNAHAGPDHDLTEIRPWLTPSVPFARPSATPDHHHRDPGRHAVARGHRRPPALRPGVAVGETGRPTMPTGPPSCRCVPVPRLCQRDAHLGQAPPVQGTRRRLAEIRWQHVHWSRGMPVYHHGGDRTGVDNSQSDKPTATLAPLARAVCRREGRRRSLLGALIRSGTSRLCRAWSERGITHLSPPCAEAEG